MRIIDIAIEEIATAKGLPCCARGHATFADGRRYRFEANLAHGYGEQCVSTWNAAGKAIDPDGPSARQIRDRLGFTEIATRERAAIGAFEHERVRACEALIRC